MSDFAHDLAMQDFHEWSSYFIDSNNLHGTNRLPTKSELIFDQANVHPILNDFGWTWLDFSCFARYSVLFAGRGGTSISCCERTV
jgi:hypothetical protein